MYRNVKHGLIYYTWKNCVEILYDLVVYVYQKVCTVTSTNLGFNADINLVKMNVDIDSGEVQTVYRQVSY